MGLQAASMSPRSTGKIWAVAEEQLSSAEFVVCEEKSTCARNHCNEVKLSLTPPFHVRIGVKTWREMMHLTFRDDRR